MTHFDDHAEMLLDAVRSGEATDAQRAEFEALVRADPALGEEVELQRRVDASLARWCAPAAGVGNERRSAPGRRRWALALAASVAIAGLGAVVAWQAGVLPSASGRGGGGGAISPFTRLTAEGVYREAEAGRFIPAWRCETDEQFIDAVRSKTGREVLLPLSTPGVEIIGWNYSDATKPVVSSVSMWLFVRTDDGPRVVIVDRLDKDRRVGGLNPGGSEAFRAFRREINGLVLYEITTSDAPVTLEHFVVPGDAPEAGGGV